tara:strand:- start:567 stop:1190 length:624 start_codon:yes stop_codon:yes gene_type:complete
MKISYAITVCNELDEITRLLNFLLDKKRKEDEIVVLFDRKKGTPKVWSRLQELNDEPSCRVESATFENHFADWKNLLTTFCTGDYIFQIDADETPHPILLSFLPALLENNPLNEVYLVPRINTVKGLTQKHIDMWAWKVDENEWINFPDNQWRIWKNIPEIKWKNKVHEVLEGYKTFASLPSEEVYCLYHPKNIDKQEKQNNFYSTL